MILYADDIVVLAETPQKLQYMLDATFIWCSKWLLNVNEKKSQIMHIRKPRVKRSNFEFNIGNKKLEYITVYVTCQCLFNVPNVTLIPYFGRILVASLSNVKCSVMLWSDNRNILDYWIVVARYCFKYDF